jgi:hypothetical protein
MLTVALIAFAVSLFAGLLGFERVFLLSIGIAFIMLAARFMP